MIEYMNKAYLSAISTLALLLTAAIILPGIHTGYAQYAPEPGSIEEQLRLAREKTSLAEQQGAYGSGTSMVSANVDSTVLFIIILVVIFGGVAGAFFARSRSARKAAYTQETTTREPDWKSEAQRYKDELEALRRSQNR